MSSSSNSFLRGQRKSDLLELAETVGLEKYVRALFPLKLSRPLENCFATRGLASRPGPSHRGRPRCWSCRIAPSRTAELCLNTDARCRHMRSPRMHFVPLQGNHPVTNKFCWI